MAPSFWHEGHYQIGFRELTNRAVPHSCFTAANIHFGNALVERSRAYSDNMTMHSHGVGVLYTMCELAQAGPVNLLFVALVGDYSRYLRVAPLSSHALSNLPHPACAILFIVQLQQTLHSHPTTARDSAKISMPAPMASSTQVWRRSSLKTKRSASAMADHINTCEVQRRVHDSLGQSSSRSEDDEGVRTL